jgi:hypothetical protein
MKRTAKNRTSVAAALLLAATMLAPLRAQFLLTEYFDGRTVGAADENASNPASPAVGQWTGSNDAGTGSSPTVVSQPLVYAGYSASGRGHAMQFTSVSAHPQRNTALCLSVDPLPYPCQPQGGFIAGSNVFYTAFLLDLSATTTTEMQEIFAYYRHSTVDRRGCVLYQLSSDKKSARFSILKRNEPTIPALTWTAYHLISKPILLVVKYTHVCIDERSFGHASFRLFVNPDPAKTEAANSAAGLDAYGNDYGYDADLRYVAFRQSGRTDMKAGSIRISNSFQETLTGTGTGTAIDLPATDGGLSVYGNSIIPTGAASGQVWIYDVNATLLRTYRLSPGTPVSTGLETGIYLLRYRSLEGEQLTRKIYIR